MTVPHRERKPADPDLRFCANCQVSVAAIELERGTAKRTPRGRIFCSLCARAKPAERATRRLVLEQEFADDAPITEPAPIPGPVPAPTPTPRAAPSAARTPARRDPIGTDPTLEERVGQLERTILRMQEQLHRLEQRVDSGPDA